MRTCFLGSPPFATPVLELLLASPLAPELVVSTPDRPVGRKRVLVANALAERAREAGARVLQPPTVKDEAFLADLQAFAPDVILVVAYGEYLTASFRALAAREILNVHPSLLPRHRGASPIQAAVAAGDAVTGVTIQRVAAEMDAGDVLLALETELGADETAGELSERLAELGGEAALRALEAVRDGTAEFTPQDPARVTTCSKLTVADGRLDWAEPAEALRNRVRAMNPWPLARTTLPNGRDLLVLEAKRVDDVTGSGAPGEVVGARERFLVATGDGVLELASVKREGKQAVSGEEFLRGARLEAGALLSTGASEGAR